MATTAKSWCHNRELNVQQFDLPSQQKLYGINNYNDKNMQVSHPTFNGLPSNSGMSYGQGNIARIRKPELQFQGPGQQIKPGQQEKAPLLQKLGLQSENPLQDVQLLSPTYMRPQQNTIRESTFQTSHSVGDNWKEELFNKITNLKDLFLPLLMEKQRKIANSLQEMGFIDQHEKIGEYERMQKLLLTCKKMCTFLNFSRDKMSEKVQKIFPVCENWLHKFFKDQNEGHVSSIEQLLPTSDAQSLKQPLLLQSPAKQHTVTAQVQEGSLVISVSENEDVIGLQSDNSITELRESCDSSLPEEPFQQLIKAVKSMSQDEFSASVSDMESALRMGDRTAGQIADNGSNFVVGEDLAVTTNYCGQK